MQNIPITDFSSHQILHGSCIAFDNQAVLLLGKSGIGKSDLTLRLIDKGAILVSDDQVQLEKNDSTIIATYPPKFKGLIEVRGLGILRVQKNISAPLALVVQLVDNHADIERLPEQAFYELLGVQVPLITIFPFDASSPLKIKMAVAALHDSSMMVAGAFIPS